MNTTAAYPHDVYSLWCDPVHPVDAAIEALQLYGAAGIVVAGEAQDRADYAEEMQDDWNFQYDYPETIFEAQAKDADDCTNQCLDAGLTRMGILCGFAAVVLRKMAKHGAKDEYLDELSRLDTEARGLMEA